MTALQIANQIINLWYDLDLSMKCKNKNKKNKRVV